MSYLQRRSTKNRNRKRGTLSPHPLEKTRQEKLAQIFPSVRKFPRKSGNLSRHRTFSNAYHTRYPSFLEQPFLKRWRNMPGRTRHSFFPVRISRVSDFS